MSAVSMLHGRDAELARLHALLDAARDGAGSAVVVLGESGMGKTALLESLDAGTMTTLRVRGVPAERDLPFGGLHRLLSPVAEALDAVRGSADGLPPHYGVYELLCRLATRRPLLCCVDDAQWLDRHSLEVLGFVARRLVGQRVALVLAARPELAHHDAVAGVAPLWLSPLSDDACQRLLRDRIDRDVPAGLRATLADLAGGNPLDLVALAESLTRDQLAGRAPLPDELPEGPRRAGYRDRLAALSSPARHALLCAIAESTVDITLLRRLGDVDELQGLLRVDGSAVRLPSPVVGSTLYAMATPEERRAAHAALARELPVPQRTWHEAMATPTAGDALADAAASAPRPPPPPCSNARPRSPRTRPCVAVACSTPPGTRGGRAVRAGHGRCWLERPMWTKGDAPCCSARWSCVTATRRSPRTSWRRRPPTSRARTRTRRCCCPGKPGDSAVTCAATWPWRARSPAPPW